MNTNVARRSYRRAGRVVPETAMRLRGRSVVLKPGQEVGWHSTHSREELLIGISGTVSVERRDRRKRIRAVPLPAGQCLFVPARTAHRVVNRSSRMAHYIYVTG